MLVAHVEIWFNGSYTKPLIFPETKWASWHRIRGKEACGLERWMLESGMEAHLAQLRGQLAQMTAAGQLLERYATDEKRKT